MVAEYCTCAELLRNNVTDSSRRYPDSQNPGNGRRMRMQVLPGLVVRRPGFEATIAVDELYGATPEMPN